MMKSANRRNSNANIAGGLAALRYGLALWSADQHLIYYNKAFADLFEPLLPFTKNLCLREFLAKISVVSDAAPSSTSEFTSRSPFEYVLSDGRTLEISVDTDSTGTTAMTVQDVTIEKRGERALRKAKEIAELADKTKSRFLRAANHDLRQPLATLKILIYSCLGETEELHRKDLLHAMDISVSIMEDLLGALLQIGQLDAGRISPRITTFQLSQLLARLKIQFSHAAAEKGLDLGFSGTAASITSDKALLERILSNLISNAIRYTDTGTILVGCRRRGENLRIDVIDTGRGIATENVERIFDEFFQVDDARRSKNRGLGVGLNIVKRLADLLDHKVEVESVLGRGSRFSIAVPLGSVWQSEIGEPAITEMIGGEFAGKNTLVIEDDPALRQAIRDLLERWGINVDVVASLEEAQELINATGRTPHIILSDHSLRGQEGTAVVTSIREMIGAQVPSIIMTADTDPKLIARIRAESFPVLIKPVSPPRLRVLMHNLLYEPEQQGTT
jgi:signal transduction histidine kinase/CheY-like chemotaxis protein